MRYTFRLLIVACVLGITFAAGRWAQAQAPGLQPQTPTVLSGNDIGFRVDGRKGNTPRCWCASALRQRRRNEPRGGTWVLTRK
jgi:hypothetical protein